MAAIETAVDGSRPEMWRLSNDDADDTDGGILSIFLSMLSDGVILYFSIVWISAKLGCL